jgi:hypothetical protein
VILEKKEQPPSADCFSVMPINSKMAQGATRECGVGQLALLVLVSVVPKGTLVYFPYFFSINGT